MPFALCTEDRTGDSGDMRLLKKNLSRSPAVLVDLLGIRKGLKRARGRRAIQPNLIQPGDQQIAALAILLFHANNL